MITPDEEVMVFRGFCEHGKVRALLCESRPGDSPEHVKSTKASRKKIAGKAYSVDIVNVIEARKSDLKCEECDSRRNMRRR